MEGVEQSVLPRVHRATCVLYWQTLITIRGIVGSLERKYSQSHQASMPLQPVPRICPYQTNVPTMTSKSMKNFNHISQPTIIRWSYIPP